MDFAVDLLALNTSANSAACRAHQRLTKRHCQGEGQGEIHSVQKCLWYPLLLVELSPLPVYRHSTAVAMMSSNWIAEVAPPRGFPETCLPQLIAPPKPHPGVFSGSQVRLAETHTGGGSCPQFLVWSFEATISTHLCIAF